MDADDLKKKLTPEQYAVTQEGATEAPFTGEYYNNHDDGVYRCVVCGHELFSSDTKFDSGSGWPSFTQPYLSQDESRAGFTDPMNREHVELIPDDSGGMRRTEVKCKNCGAHLGHVFDDGPADKGGQRYCINSCALNFQKGEHGKKE